MLRSIALVCVCALTVLFLSPSVQADIIAYDCAADGDGAIVMDAIDFDFDTYDMTCAGRQYRAPAHILGDFSTDTELDPTVRFLSAVQNETDFVWTQYLIEVAMSKPFSLANATGPAGWTPTLTQPTLQGGQHIGSILYTGGAPIAIGDEATFGYKASFLGGISFTQTMTPLPEPGTLLLLASGSVLMFLRRRRARLA